MSKVINSNRFGQHAIKGLLFIFIPFLYLQASIINLEQFQDEVSLIKHLDEMFVLGIFLLSIILIPHKVVLRNRYSILLISIYFVHAIISAIYNDISLRSLFLSIFLFVKGFLLYWAVSSVTWKKKQENYFVNILIVLSILCTIISIFQVLGVSLPWELDHRQYFGFDAATSIFNHHTLWGTASSLGIFVVLGLIFSFPKEKRLKLILGFLFFGLILSTSRRHLVSIPFSFLLCISFLSYGKERLKYALKYSIAIALLLIVIYPYISTAISGSYSEYIENAANRDRYALYYGGIKLANESPIFGRGPGTYGSWTSVVFESPVYHELRIHRIVKEQFMNGAPYAGMLGEGGWLGFGIILIIFFWIFQRIIKIGKFFNRIGYDRSIAAIVFLMFINGLLESIVHPYFTGSIATYVFYCFFGLLNSKYFSKKNV